jgi:hypothetical protein
MNKPNGRRLAFSCHQMQASVSARRRTTAGMTARIYRVTIGIAGLVI